MVGDSVGNGVVGRTELMIFHLYQGPFACTDFSLPGAVLLLFPAHLEIYFDPSSNIL